MISATLSKYSMNDILNIIYSSDSDNDKSIKELNDDFFHNLQELCDSFNNQNIVYGEITRDGVDKIINMIHKFKGKDLSNFSFIDLGSGEGKLCLHIASKTNFNNVTGIEIVENRYKLSIKNYQKVEERLNNVNFINDDFMNYDISNFDVIFINDLCIKFKESKQLFDKCKLGTHFICFKKISDPVEEFSLEGNWGRSPIFKYFIKS